MGKGDSRRPSAVPPSTIESNWSQTFGKSNASTTTPPSSDTSPVNPVGAETTTPSTPMDTPTVSAAELAALEKVGMRYELFP